MFYLEEINYQGDPPKAVLPGGLLVLTTMTEDVPVTHIKIHDCLQEFRFVNAAWLDRANVSMTIEAGSSFDTSMIGEIVIIFETLDALLENSIEAKASRFVLRLVENPHRVFLTALDDGDGLCEEGKSLILKEMLTTKGNGLGASLFLAAQQISRIGGKLRYDGAGLDEKGASFTMSFLKEMPY